MKKFLLTLGVTAAVYLCIMAGMLICAHLATDSGPTVPRTIFTSLSSFDRLEKYELDTNGMIDADLAGLDPEDSYISELEYRSNKYSVYAYIFGSSEDAKQYYANVTGDTDTSQLSQGSILHSYAEL